MSLSVPSQLPGVEMATAEPLLKLLIFGLTGAGKTRLALSFCQDARTSPVLLLDATGGTTGILAEAKAAGASVRAIDDTDSILAYTTWLVAEKGGGFKTLIIDDFSESFSLTKGKVAKKFGHPSAEELEPRQHAALYERSLKVYRALRKVASPVAIGGAGVHVLVTCWSELKAARGEDDLKSIPKFAGQFGFQTPAYFDTVALLEHSVTRSRNPQTKEVTHEFKNKLISMSTDTLTKDRLGIIGGEMAMPTATKLLDALSTRFAPKE